MHSAILSTKYITRLTRSRLPKLLLTCAICIGLSACGSRGAKTDAAATTLTATEYLQMANTVQGAESTKYQLMAVSQLIESQQLSKAEKILHAMNIQPLPQNQRNIWQLRQAQIFLLQDRPQQALNDASTLDAGSLSQDQQEDLYKLLAQAYGMLGNPDQSLIQRHTWFEIANEPQKKQILQFTWMYLQSLNQQQQYKLSQSTNSINQGWYQLLQISRQLQLSDQQLLAELIQWRRQYPNHPANQLIRKKLNSGSISFSRPKHISLLLPITGQYAKISDAIRNGFFAAYYASNIDDRPTINVVDTNNQDITSLYKQSVAAGSDFIVGPLTKENLHILIQRRELSVPTLSLNSIQGEENPLLIQFALSPLDEAAQVVNLAWSTHHKRAIIIGMNTPRGKTIIADMTKSWQNMGGKVLYTWPASKKQNLSSAIQQILLVTNYRQRRRSIIATIGRSARSLPRRRQDSDVILMAVDADLARQIQPLLKYNFAGGIPIYSTSQVYTGYPNPSLDRDLNGIKFCSSPWVLQKKPQNDNRLNKMKTQISKLWPTANKKYARFFAMGIDAYDLSNHLNRLLMLPYIGWPAASGNLFLSADQQIYRQLNWAHFYNGKPKLLEQ